MRYAGGRPLWQLSLAVQRPEAPLPVLRWSPTIRRRVEHVRDRIMRHLGTTDDPLFEEVLPDEVAIAAIGRRPISVNWRKPLSIEEINQLAPTDDVRARPGRS
jgi:hypothetical protein